MVKPSEMPYARMIVLLLWLAAVRTASAAPVDANYLRPASASKYSPAQRMATARLKAAHEDAERIKRSRRSLPPLAELNDYRSIFHAHAEDSAHTGGTRPEMLAEAKRAGVSVVFLSDHYRPPRDFINDSWRGARDGVLFIPGSECRGFLVHPTRSILSQMESETGRFIDEVTADGGLIFLSHIEERPEHATAGLTGMEIYNRHADAKKDVATLLALAMRMTDPDQLEELTTALRLYPDELLAAQVQYPSVYLEKWDADSRQRRLTGVGANDCHHNQVFVVKMVDENTVRIGTTVDSDDQMRTLTAALRPGIRQMTKGRSPGDVLARLDFDPYQRSFRNVSTHVFAHELTEGAIRSAMRAGHAYVSHDWMCDPTGFAFAAVESTGDSTAGIAGFGTRKALMGDELTLQRDLKLVARFPVECHTRLIRNGEIIRETAAESFSYPLTQPGVYRVEGWLTLDDEARPWIYSNPIYVR